MSDLPLPTEDEDLALAGEYVLGTLSLPDRLAAESRIRSEGGFARLVQAWENHLAGMNGDYAEAPVPPELLARIEARLFPKASATRSWFGWALGGLAAAVAVLAFLVLPLLQPGPEMLAHMVSEDGATAYDVAWAEGDLTVTRIAGAAAPAGQVHELWIIPPDGAPVSMGLLERGAVVLPTERPDDGWTLAVSLEPAGGSPTGQPTGPVLMAAEIGI